MTTIVIRKDSNQKYKGFTCMGHADYVKWFRRWRPDVLCAGISVLVITTINALAELGGEEILHKENEDTGFIQCDFLKPLQDKSAFLMDAMVMGLKELSNEYGSNYLKIEFEEV